ncbi:MAG: squalene synthase HpnC [Alphaproteobacteria bacterium]|nr:squalene synthase HpnC [Alphaproteobacteria bacterium]
MTTPMIAESDTASGKNRDTENFPVGSFLIRPDLRTHVHAFYNFARAADDISDHPLLPAQEKIRRLDRFAAVLVDDNAKDVPSAIALRDSLLSMRITPQHSLDLLTAFKRDATQLRYRDWDDLMDYCRYSASPVGRHVLALHGIGESAWPSNDALCSALQVINHIQDCADDYRQLDRVYLPQDMLAAHGGNIAELSNERSTPGLRATYDAMLVRLEEMLPAARSLPRHVPDLRLKCETSVIGVLADRLIRLLRRHDPLCDRVKLSKPALLEAAMTGVLRAWF